jgi:integrase
MSTKSPSREVPVTLADVVRLVSAMEDLPPQRRSDLCSAVRRVAALHDRPPADIPADVAALRRTMTLFAPNTAGMAPRRWRNVRSLLATALTLTGATVVRRRTSPLAPAWRDLLGRIPNGRERDRLSRFAGYCTTNDIPPECVCDTVVDGFARQLTENSLIDRPKHVHRSACLAWNRAAATIVGWPEHRLTVPDNRSHHALPLSTYPASFGADLEAWFDHLSGKNLFSEVAARPISPTTVRSNRRLVLQLATAMVRSGRDPSSITRLADLIAIDALKPALETIWRRAGEKKTAHLHNHAMMLIKVAKHWVKVPDHHLEQLRAIRSQVAPGQSGMTARNRARMRQFDDETNLARLLDLPEAIARRLPTDGSPTYVQAVQMQSAVAIVILLFAPIRVKNLASLSFDRHIVRPRAGDVWHLVIPAHEVKNTRPFESEVPRTARKLLDVYVRRCLPVLAPEASGFLFPARNGGSKAPGHLGEQIQRTIIKETGLDLNVHAFRHLTAKLFLRENPGEHETVRSLLGHNSLATTVRADCGTEQADALRRYDALIDQFRSGGPKRRGS